MSVTLEPLDPPVETDDIDDVMLTSAGPHLSDRNRDDDVMRQHATWASHSVTHVSPGLIQPFSNFKNDLNFRNS